VTSGPFSGLVAKCRDEGLDAADVAVLHSLVLAAWTAPLRMGLPADAAPYRRAAARLRVHHRFIPIKRAQGFVCSVCRPAGTMLHQHEFCGAKLSFEGVEHKAKCF